MLIRARINKFVLTLLAASAMIEDTAAGYLPATVRTSSGSVEGHFANKSSGVSEYLGIPFVSYLKLNCKDII
jgi:hypothetical protein